MRRGIGSIFLVTLLVFSITFASAGWFSDTWGKITGNVVSDLDDALVVELEFEEYANNYISFTGKRDFYVLNSLEDDLSGKEGLAFSVWIKSNNFSSQNRVIFSDTVDGNARFEITLTKDGEVCVGLNTGNQSWSVGCTANEISFEEWNHLVINWDGETGNASVVINNVIETIKEGHVGVLTRQGSSRRAGIGDRPDQDNWYYDAFNGEMDNVKIYDRTLSADEIGELYEEDIDVDFSCLNLSREECIPAGCNWFSSEELCMGKEDLEQRPTCIDSDAGGFTKSGTLGKVYGEKGNVTYLADNGSNETVWDSCSDDLILKEYYCLLGSMKNVNYDCSSYGGRVCVDGACVEGSVVENITTCGDYINEFDCNNESLTSRIAQGECISEPWVDDDGSFYVVPIDSCYCSWDDAEEFCKLEYGIEINETQASCESTTAFLKAPTDITIENTQWELRYNDSWEYGSEKSYYVSFKQRDDYYSETIYVEEMIIGDDAYYDVQERLDDALEYGLCQQQRVYADYETDDYQIIYLCKNVWDVAYDSREITSDNDQDITAIWVNGDKMFRVESRSYDYDNCYSYEDCKAMEERKHREEQRDVTEFLGKLIDNDAEYVGGFYLPWQTEQFVKYLLEDCESEIEEEEYQGSWSCKTEPVICPPHGEQTEVCTRWTDDGREERESTLSCSPGICSGCYVPRWFDYSSDNTCIPYGIRFEQQTGWSIEDVFFNDTNQEGLSVAQVNSYGDDVDLVVYEDGTALLVLETRSDEFVNITLEKDETYDWDALTGDSHGDNILYYNLIVKDIVYDNVSYEDSYVSLEFQIAGTYEQRTEEALNAYCDIDGQIKEQKITDKGGDWAKCQNNYECDSNLCSSGECIDLKAVAEEASAFKEIWTKITCRFSALFGIDESYEQCLADRFA